MAKESTKGWYSRGRGPIWLMTVFKIHSVILAYQVEINIFQFSQDLSSHQIHKRVLFSLSTLISEEDSTQIFNNERRKLQN